MAMTPFDPTLQSISLQLQDGSLTNFTVGDLDQFYLYSVQISINYAAQLGASLLLLIVLLLLAKPEKRLSPIYIINGVSLVLNFIRNLLNCLFFTGPFSEVYTVFANDYSRVPNSAYSTSVAAIVLTFLLLLSVEASLMFQVHVVCLTLRKVQRDTISACSLVVASLAILFRLVLCIKNIQALWSSTGDVSVQWLASASNITTSISICYFCLVFVVKLAFALRQRVKLGIRSFGPMQIVFIMGCQTLVIPAIFSILQYVVDYPAMDSNVLTLVAVFLPLSSMWASSSVQKPSSAPSGFSDQKKPFARPKILVPLSDIENSETCHSNTSFPSPSLGGHLPKIDLEAQGISGSSL